MDEIKVYEDGNVFVFKPGSKIKMIKDIIFLHEYSEEFEMFIERGTEGIITAVSPRIAIIFDVPNSSSHKEFFLQEDLIITDIAELVKERHLRLVK